MATLENFPVVDGVKAKLGGSLISWFLRLQSVIAALVQGSGFVFSHGNRAIVSDAAGALTESDVTAIELGFVDGVTSAIQTQINTKVPYSGATGAVDLNAQNLTNIGNLGAATAHIGGATDYAEFEADGTLKLNGAATVWDDVVVSLGNIKAPAADPPTWTAYRGGELPLFGATATNVLYFNAQIPHSYKEAGDLSFHVHVAYPNANTGDSRWQVTYSWANIDGTFGAQTTVAVTVAAPGVADSHTLHHIATITGTGKTISSCLICSLSRLGADGADTYASGIYAVSADFHVEKDTIGSRTDTTK
jgi:hypothetical protein